MPDTGLAIYVCRSILRLGATFNDGMTVLSGMTSAAVVAACDCSGAKLLVDVAGGHGRLIAALLKANPEMRGILFDLPRVVEGALPLLEKERRGRPL